MEKEISRAKAAAVLNSLKGGVVPRVGLEYITVGRKSEIQALLGDVSLIENGGSAVRFIEGSYGSGKTFLMHALRNHVMEKNFVVTDAELSVDRRFIGNRGQGLATYRELIRNMAVSARPDNGALSLILDKWIGSIENYVVQTEGFLPGQEAFDLAVSKRIYEITSAMEERINGFDFGKVIAAYYKGHRTGNAQLQKNAYRWLCGEYATKTEAREDLGVNLIVTDDNWFDFIRLFADFVVKAGYAGLYLCMDELATIYEIPSRVGREYNYGKILSIYNDVLQGKVRNMGVIMSITKEALEDRVRGIYSYAPLESRLRDTRREQEGIPMLRDMAAPVIKIEALHPGELFVLLEKLTRLHEIVYDYSSRLDDGDYSSFLKSQYEKKRGEEGITVREVIRSFITLLNLTQQHADKTKDEIMLGIL